MQQAKISKNQIIVIGAAFFATLLMVIGFFLFEQNTLRFNGKTPDDIGIQTNVALKFSQTITNGSDIMKNLTISPKVDVNVIVEGSSVIISPVDNFSSTKYTVNIPKVAAKQGSITNFKTDFEASDKNPASSDKTSIDLDDIATKQYPQLRKVADNPATNYDLQYVFDGKKVVFMLYLIEPLDVEEDPNQPFKELIASNKQAITYIEDLGIPKDKYVITYQSEVQKKLIDQYDTTSPSQ